MKLSNNMVASLWLMVSMLESHERMTRLALANGIHVR
jgi:hypothetical protein